MIYVLYTKIILNQFLIKNNMNKNKRYKFINEKR